MADDTFLKGELDDLKTRCEKVVPGSKLVACVRHLVQVRIQRTEDKELTANFQLKADYPASPLIIELKSKRFDHKLLQGLEGVAGEEAKKWIGKQQMLPVLVFLRKFIDDNPLCVCRDEVAYIQKNLIEDCDSLKLKQKTSQLFLHARGGNYYIKMTFTVPDLYPKEKLGIECVEHNFPDLLKQNFVGHCVEMARSSVEPPAMKKRRDPPFQPTPSLQRIAVFVIGCVKRYYKEACPVCKEQALPTNPKDIVTDSFGEKHVERVYCGHIYHHKCLDTYMKTPPFAGGKKCPSCDKRIYHDKWSATPELAEARWAHKQAKQRELDEVVDFLS